MKKKASNFPAKKRGFKILEVYFSGRASTDREFHNTVGLMRSDERKIYIEKSLPKISIGTKQLTLNHELAHARLNNIQIEKKLRPEKEEAFVELEAVTRTRNKFLTHAEIKLKEFLTNGGKLNPRINKDFRKIVSNILKVIGVKQRPKLIDELSTGILAENK